MNKRLSVIKINYILVNMLGKEWDEVWKYMVSEAEDGSVV